LKTKGSLRAASISLLIFCRTNNGKTLVQKTMRMGMKIKTSCKQEIIAHQPYISILTLQNLKHIIDF